MNTAGRLMSILALSLLLAACAQPTRETPTDIEPTEPTTPTTDPVEVVSYGEERPVCRQTSEACWERNRRVEIVYTAR
jgi:hypothetical protein